jgi:hypothetical protein
MFAVFAKSWTLFYKKDIQNINNRFKINFENNFSQGSKFLPGVKIFLVGVKILLNGVKFVI